MKKLTYSFVLVTSTALAIQSATAATYLNDDAGVTVSLGASNPGPDQEFVNVSNAQSLANTIDVDNAADTEFHNQSTHVWYNKTSDGLELDFNFGAEYDLSNLYFWNFYTEFYDVDQIDFILKDSTNTLIASPTLFPQIGTNLGSEEIPSVAYSFEYDEVQYVNAIFTGTNNQVDFNNIGWMGTLSDDETPPVTTPPDGPSQVPLPAGLPLLLVGIGAFGLLRRRNR